MKFTNAYVVFSVVCIVSLNSCSSLPPSFPAIFEEEKSVSQVAVEPLTPIQVKVRALQALPNLYKKNSNKHKFNAQTLSQFKAALALKKQGKSFQAEDSFIALSEQHPNLSGIWLQLALLVKEQRGEALDEKAEEKRNNMMRYLNHAISANSFNYLAHNELALLLRQQGHFQQALHHYELALKSWPAFAQGYLNRGILYDLYMGKKSLALADYELYKALSNDQSRQLKGWIIDLHRQIKTSQQVTQTGAML